MNIATRFLPHVVRPVVGSSSEIVQNFKNFNSQSSKTSSFSLVNSSSYNGLQNYKTLASVDPPYRPSSLSTVNPPLNPDCLKFQKLSISSTSQTFVLSLPHSENDHAHSIMRSLPAYTYSTVDSDKLESLLPCIDHSKCPPPLPGIDWSTVLPQYLIGSFAALCKEAKVRDVKLSDPCYAPLVNAIIQNVSFMSNDQLKEVLVALKFYMAHIDNPNAPNYSQLWNCLDNECVRRVPKMSIEETFIFGDLFFQLRLSRICAFTRAMLNILAHKLPDLAPHHLVQYAFHLNLSRAQPGSVNPLMYEKAVAEAIDKISLEELGVIAMGLFKSQLFMQSDNLCNAFLQRILKGDLSGTSSITMAALFKVLRKSVKTHHADHVYKLLDKLVPLIPQLSLQAQLQVALVGCECLVLHSKVINDVAINFADNCSELRLKDIERIVLCLMLFNFSPPSKRDILQVFANELRNPARVSEINSYPKSFLSCVTYLATMGVMPLDLISTALQPSMVNSLQSSNNYTDIGREILELDYLIEIEIPEYEGHRLKPETRMALVSKHFSRHRCPQDVKGINSLTRQERLTMEVENKLQCLLGKKDAVACTHILPQCPSPDVVFCTDSFGTPVTVPDIFLSSSKSAIKQPLPIDTGTGPLQWHVLVIGGKNNFIRGTSRVRGQVHMKMRQLKTLGYSVCLVPFMDFSKKSVRRKLEMLNGLLTQQGCLLPDEERIDSAIVAARAEN